MTRKGGTRGGGWVHPKGANSMAVPGLHGRMFRSRRTSRLALYGLHFQHSWPIFCYGRLAFPGDLIASFLIGGRG